MPETRSQAGPCGRFTDTIEDHLLVLDDDDLDDCAVSTPGIANSMAIHPPKIKWTASTSANDRCGYRPNNRHLWTSHYHIVCDYSHQTRQSSRSRRIAVRVSSLASATQLLPCRPHHKVSFRNFAVCCCYHAMGQDHRLRRFMIGVRTKDPRTVERIRGQWRRFTNPRNRS